MLINVELAGLGWRLTFSAENSLLYTHTGKNAHTGNGGQSDAYTATDLPFEHMVEIDNSGVRDDQAVTAISLLQLDGIGGIGGIGGDASCGNSTILAAIAYADSIHQALAKARAGDFVWIW